MSIFCCCFRGAQESVSSPVEAKEMEQEWKLLLVRRVRLETSIEERRRGFEPVRAIRKEVLLTSSNGLSKRAMEVMERTLLKAAFPQDAPDVEEVLRGTEKIREMQEHLVERDDKQAVAFARGESILQLSTRKLWSGELFEDPILVELRAQSGVIASLAERLAEYRTLEEESESDLYEVCRRKYRVNPREGRSATKREVLARIRKEIKRQIFVQGASYLEKPLPHIAVGSSCSMDSSSSS